MPISKKKDLGAAVAVPQCQPGTHTAQSPPPPPKDKAVTRGCGPCKKDLDLQVSAVQVVRSRVFRTGVSISRACQLEGIPEHLYDKWCKIPEVTVRMKTTTISSFAFLAAASARVAEYEKGKCYVVKAMGYFESPVEDLPPSISPSESSKSAVLDAEKPLPSASLSGGASNLRTPSHPSKNGINDQLPPVASNSKNHVFNEEWERKSSSRLNDAPSAGSRNKNAVSEVSHGHNESKVTPATFNSAVNNTQPPLSSKSVFSSTPTNRSQTNNRTDKIGVIEWVHKSSLSLSDALVDLSKHLEMMAVLDAKGDNAIGNNTEINRRKKLELLNRMRKWIIPQMIHGIGTMRKVTDPSGSYVGNSSLNGPISSDVTTPASVRSSHGSPGDMRVPKTPCKSGSLRGVASTKSSCDRNLHISVQNKSAKPTTQHWHKSHNLSIGTKATRWYTPIQNVTNPTRLPNNAHKKTERWHTPTPESFKPTQRHSAVQSKHIETIGVTKQPRTSSRHSSNDPNIPTPLHYFIKQTHVTKTTYLHEPASGESNTLAPLQQTSIHNVIHPTPLRKPIQKSLPTQTAVAPNSINEKKRQSDLEDYTGGNNNNKKLRRDTTIIFRND
mmetsp:Transcript_1109/g.1803  ORF Transcript_1109/g.1803 Transcript_1109/m.1803 type:complete len:611 (+) Transcript_1109:79-1911(+)